MTCLLKHYAIVKQDHVYNPGNDLSFVNKNLLEGAPLLDLACNRMDCIPSLQIWKRELESAAHAIQSTRQAQVEQENKLTLISIPLDGSILSTKQCRRKLEIFTEKWGSYCKTIQPIKSKMLPCAVFRVRSEGYGSINGKLISKICFGDGIHVLLELCLPLHWQAGRVHHLPKDRVFSLNIDAKMNWEIVPFLNNLNYYMTGVNIEQDIGEAWVLLRQLMDSGSHQLKVPHCIDIAELWKQAGGWCKTDSSLAILNWIIAGAMQCENKILATANRYNEEMKSLSTVFRLYMRDHLIGIRNVAMSFYICNIPYWFPVPEHAQEFSTLTTSELGEFIPCAIEELASRAETENEFNIRLGDLKPTGTHLCRKQFLGAEAKGSLDIFDRVFSDRPIRWTKLVWNQVAELGEEHEVLDYKPLSQSDIETVGKSYEEIIVIEEIQEDNVEVSFKPIKMTLEDEYEILDYEPASQSEEEMEENSDGEIVVIGEVLADKVDVFPKSVKAEKSDDLEIGLTLVSNDATNPLQIRSINFTSMHQLLAEYPSLKCAAALKAWILSQPGEARKLLLRSQVPKSGHVPEDYFSFGNRRFARLFQTTLSEFKPIKNYLHNRKIKNE